MRRGYAGDGGPDLGGIWLCWISAKVEQGRGESGAEACGPDVRAELTGGFNPMRPCGCRF